MNLLHELPPGPDGGSGVFDPNVIYVVVEVPKGSRNKYEYDKRQGFVKLDRVLFSPIHYPGDYGLIPQTHYDDGDPLDVLVMVNEPTFPGCIIEARPIGLFRMMDRGVAVDKVLAVPAYDPNFRDYYDLPHIPQHFLAETGHFFEVYKELEGIQTEVLGWERATVAREQILYAVGLYRKRLEGNPSGASSSLPANGLEIEAGA
jgi:inorganic pyrophosphatase